MKGGYVLFVFSTLYLSVVIGTIIRLKSKGITGKWIILSPVLPVFLTALNFSTTLKAIKKENTLNGKMRQIEIMFRFMTQYFTLLVEVLAHRAKKEKLQTIKPKGRAKIYQLPGHSRRRSRFTEIVACYHDVYKSHELFLKP